MSEYVYQEYPKCLYQKGGGTLVVDSVEEESSAVQMGWMTAEQYHNPVIIVTPVPAVPEGEEGHKPDDDDESNGAQ